MLIAMPENTAFGDEGTAEPRRDVPSLDRPPHSGRVDDAVKGADGEKKQGGGDRAEIRDGSSAHGHLP